MTRAQMLDALESLFERFRHSSAFRLDDASGLVLADALEELGYVRYARFLREFVKSLVEGTTHPVHPGRWYTVAQRFQAIMTRERAMPLLWWNVETPERRPGSWRSVSYPVRLRDRESGPLTAWVQGLAGRVRGATFEVRRHDLSAEPRFKLAPGTKGFVDPESGF